jgi:hypothetical protein
LKRKSVKRKTAKSPAVALVRRDERGNIKRLTENWLRQIDGFEVPPDLQEAIEAYSGETYLWLDSIWHSEPWRFFTHYAEDDGSRYGGANDDTDLADPASWKQPGHVGGSIELRWGYHELEIIHGAIRAAMAQGFYLAIMRYAADLKAAPEASAVLEGLRRASKKGADARRKQAAPIHRAIQKRFRELRKTVPKKTARYLRVAEEFEMSDRQVARIVDGID